MTKEAFHDGIIMAISFPGHAGDNAVFFWRTLEILLLYKYFLDPSEEGHLLLFALSLLVLMSSSPMLVFATR